MLFFPLDYNPYVVIIGDVKKSKSIKNRDGFQNYLKRILDDINEIYSDSIASRFTITLGDEFQGVLCLGKETMKVIQHIKRAVYPIELRFGIGVGTITTDIHLETSVGADGPGYHKARNSINYLKKSEKKKECACGDVYIKIDYGNSSQEILINSILELMSIIEKGWTEKQRNVVNYFLFEEVTQIKAAQYFHVSQSNIQQILSKAHFYAYRNAFDSIGKILSEVISYDES